MKRILKNEAGKPIRVFETKYGYLIKSRCGWPHTSRATILSYAALFLLGVSGLYFGHLIPEPDPPKTFSLAAIVFYASLAVVLTPIAGILGADKWFESKKDLEKQAEREKKQESKRAANPEKYAKQVGVVVKIDKARMKVKVRFGIERFFSAPIEPTSQFTLDVDRFRYITSAAKTSKFETQIFPRKKLDIVGYRTDTIGEVLSLTRILNLLLDEVRKDTPDINGQIEDLDEPIAPPDNPMI